jgi:hypothetical protein
MRSAIFAQPASTIPNNIARLTISKKYLIDAQYHMDVLDFIVPVNK